MVNAIYTHEGHTLKGTRQVAKGRGCNSPVPFMGIVPFVPIATLLLFKEV